MGNPDRLVRTKSSRRSARAAWARCTKPGDTRLDRTAAIKVSAKEFGERFLREAKTIASLNHSNICTLRDAGPDYLVMEYIEGTGIKGPPLCEPLRLAQQFKPAWLELKDNRQHARQVYQPAR